MNGALPWWQTRRFVALAVLLSALPLLWPAVPPLTDLPAHMARWRVMLGTDADVLGQWYRFEWRLAGNLGVDLIVRALAPLVGLEPAVKLAILAIPPATAAGALWISRELHGRVQPWAIAALPLAYNYALQYGFVNFALSMALALNAFALWLRLTRLRRWRLRAALFVPIALVTWLAHIVGWGILGLLVWGSEAARQRDDGSRWIAALWRASLAALPLALPLVLVLVWRSGEGAGVTLGWFRWALKLGWLGMVMRDRWIMLDLGSAVLVGGMIYHAWRSPEVRWAPRMRFALPLVLAAFVVIPFRLLDSAFADMRLAAYVAMLALVSLSAHAAMSPRRLRIVAALALGFVLVRTAATTASYALFDREWRQHLAALDHVPRGARVVALIGDACDPDWYTPRITHLHGLAVVRRAAFTNDQWHLGAGSPLTITYDIGYYSADPSQSVMPHRCDRAPYLRTVDEALDTFPRARFDYLWMIAPHRFDARRLRGLRPVWRDGDDALYRIERRGLSEVPSSH